MKICFVAFSPGTTLRKRGHGFAKYLREYGFETTVLTFFREAPPTTPQKSLGNRAMGWLTSHVRLYEKIVRYKPDIIYLLKPSPPAAFPAISSQKLLGCRLVFDTDDWELAYRPTSRNPISHLESNLVRHFEKYLATHSDLVVTASTALRNHISELGSPNEKIHYCPTGVDTEVFNPRKFSKAPHKNKILIYTGKRADVDYEYTAVIEMLSALKLVLKDHKNVKLWMTGKANPVFDKRIKEYIRRQKIEKHVFFTGFLPEEELVKTIAQADVALLPFADHILNRYKSPTNLFEYMAMELPAVAAKIGEVKLVIDEKKNGMLYAPGNQTEFAEKIITLLEKKELAKKIGISARKTVEKKYSMAILMKHLAQRLSHLD